MDTKKKKPNWHKVAQIVLIVALLVIILLSANERSLIESQRDSAIKENMQLKESLHQLDNRLNDMGIEMENLQKDVEATELENGKVKKSLEELQKENKELKELKEQLELEIIDLNERLEAKKAAESLAASKKKESASSSASSSGNSGASSSSANTSGGSWRTMNVTAYSLDGGAYSPDSPYYGMTASGAFVSPWYTVAAGPSIPFGTRVYIPYFKNYPNGGVFVVQDRGGAVGDGNLDIYMESTSDAWTFGRQNLEVQFLD